MKNSKPAAISLILLLAWAGVYKDLLSPDYLNTLNAGFLDPHYSVERFFGHIQFWTGAVLYTGLFILLPFLILLFWFGSGIAKAGGIILSTAAILEYIIILSRSEVFMYHILPKVNRYLHSPIPTLFLIALFTLNERKNGSHGQAV